jgi:hypothetical protein
MSKTPAINGEKNFRQEVFFYFVETLWVAIYTLIRIFDFIFITRCRQAIMSLQMFHSQCQRHPQ